MGLVKQFALISGVLASQSAFAWNVSVQLTADNVYAIYTGDATSATAYHGGDSNTDAQDIRDAESYNFTMNNGDVIYVAAWSDDGTSQGLLAEFNIDGAILTTSHTDWEVMATGIDLDVASPEPTLAELTAQIVLANAGNVPSGGWVPSVIGDANDGTGPNFPTLEVTSMAQTVNWAWYDSGNCMGADQPFSDGCDHDEFIVFRLVLPLGGCCLPDDGCQNTSSSNCEQIGGLYAGDGVFCELVGTCDEDPEGGACCIDGVCYDINEEKCLSEDGVWFGLGSDCTDTDVECDQEPETGACCLEGDCVEMGVQECWKNGGASYGTLSTCQDDFVECCSDDSDIQEVPTDKGCASVDASKRGLGLSVGLVGVLGMVLLRRRRARKDVL